jgi:hypothetical protein
VDFSADGGGWGFDGRFFRVDGQGLGTTCCGTGIEDLGEDKVGGDVS